MDHMLASRTLEYDRFKNGYGPCMTRTEIDAAAATAHDLGDRETVSEIAFIKRNCVIRPR